MTIALLGLGLMGRPMARRLAAADWPLRAWNRSPLASDLTTGIPLAESLADAVGEAEVVLLMLADSAATDAVIGQIVPLLRHGQLLLDMGSSDPARSQQHAAHLAEIGVEWVDAPVSGGPEGAANGTLAIMAGGSAAAFARVEALLHALGANVVHVGEAGAGHTAKVINQLIVGLTIEAIAEALTLAEAHGIAPHLIQAALRGGFADSKILQLHGTRMAERRYLPGGRVATQLKDLRLGAALAAQAGLQLPHLEDTLNRYARLVAEGYADADHSALHLLLQRTTKEAQ